MKTTMSKDVPNITQTTINRSWSGEVWKKSLPIYNAILGLDFLKELSQGTLGRDAFARYIAQDEIYLKNYYSQMYMLADLMENLQDRNLFLSFAQSGMEGEKVLHEMLIGKYSINTEVKASGVTAAYNAHICKGIATGNPCIALASVLPCMWIYNQVGIHIFHNSKLEDNPYKEWILEYGQEKFTEGVNKVLEMIDVWASKADGETLEQMDCHYLKAALYEYAFWDYGYHGDSKSYEYTESLDEWFLSRG